MKLSLSFFLLIPVMIFAQPSQNEVQEQLQYLKNGALFVRIPTAQNKIKALLDAGRETEATKVARSQQLENLKVYLAFKSAYDFSPVYFFYNLSSEAIKKGEFKGHLLNENLEPDSEIDYSGNYYVAEFDVIQTTGLSALVVKDRNFNLLQKPFPYYAKTFDLLPFVRRSRLEVVKALNKGLYNALK
jgi:hypothetical protein